MKTLEIFKDLPLSPGLIKAINEIEELENAGQPKKAKDTTTNNINLIRISGAIHRFMLAKQCYEEDTPESLSYAMSLYEKAIDHLYKDDKNEKIAINAIKTEMAEARKKIKAKTSQKE